MVLFSNWFEATILEHLVSFLKRIAVRRRVLTYQYKTSEQTPPASDQAKMV